MTNLTKIREAGIDPIRTVIIGRCEGTLWSPMLLKDVDNTEIPFLIYSPDGETWAVEMIAPYEGNETALDTEDDVYELWDVNRLRFGK